MRVGSSTDLSAQLQALENAALGAYQPNQEFSFILQQAGQSDPSGGSAAASGPATGDTASTGTGDGTLTDHESFTADNGLVAGNFDTTFTLKPVGGGVPPASS